MKIRLGMGLGALRPEDDFGSIVDSLEASGVDSLWLSEVVHQPLPEPVSAMGYVVGRTKRLKVGTGVMILPGRHPMLVAKELATLARMAPKRILPVFGLHAARAEERAHFPVAGPRAKVFDESLVLIRRLLTEPRVTHRGEFFEVADGSVGFIPSAPMDIWLGGRAPAALRRIGTYADGWLASFLTPNEAAEGIVAINRAAETAGRTVDPEHFGVSLPVAFGSVPAAMVEAVRTRRPDLDPAALVPEGWDGLERMVSEFVAAGVSKFVVRPVSPPASWHRWIEQFAACAAPMQT